MSITNNESEVEWKKGQKEGAYSIKERERRNPRKKRKGT